MLFVLLFLVLAQPAPQGREADLAAARAVFERNITAIQERDRDGYLACYLATDGLVRSSPDGFELGFADMAESAPANGSDEWPVRLVASDLQLAWVGDGIVYGTYRYRVSYDGVSATEGLSERLFRRTDDGWRIAVTTAFAAPPGTPPPPVALVGATVLDGLGGRIEDSAVIVRGGVFETVGPRSTTAVPAGIDVVDLSGKFLAPGLIDTHVHYSQTGWVDGRPDAADVRADYPYEVAMADCEAYPDRFHRAFLQSGITAVFDVGGFHWTRRLGGQTELSPDAPHVVATGPLLATMVPDFGLFDRTQFVLMEDETGVRAAVRQHHASGSDAIKVWFIVRQPSDLETYGPLVRIAGEESRAVGLPLVVHATTLESARIALEAGAHLLVHSVDDAPVDDAFVAAALDQSTYYCPTLTVTDGYVLAYTAQLNDEVRGQLGSVDASVRQRVLATESLVPRMPPERADGFVARLRRQRDTMNANIVTLLEAGVPIVLGTDAGNPLTLHGPSVFPELEAMQAAGMTAEQVLIAATSAAAGALGRAEDLGRIAAGFSADAVVLEDDPSVDASAWRSRTHVMRFGRLR